MTIREILTILLFIYFTVGIVLWCIGLWSIGGIKKYKAYLSEEMHMSDSTFYIAFIIFVFTWPTFIRRKE